MTKAIKNHVGFTLIEVLLSLAIFTVIGIATVRHISQLQNTKTSAFEKVELFDGVRSALSLMRTDLSQAFHVLLIDIGEDNRRLLQRNQPVPHSVFDGRKTEIIFTSLSHRVFYSGRRESEQAEISYFLFQNPGSKNSSLMKRESGIIDEDPYQGGKVVKILDNVTYLKFEYWDTEQLKWVEDWTSEQGAKIDRFPLAVKMNLKVGSPTGGDPLEIQTTFKIAFANNQPVLVQF
jgi:type II secretion system protein J